MWVPVQCGAEVCEALPRSRGAAAARSAVVSASLPEREVTGSIRTIGDFHTVGHACEKASGEIERKRLSKEGYLSLSRAHSERGPVGV